MSDPWATTTENVQVSIEWACRPDLSCAASQLAPMQLHVIYDRIVGSGLEPGEHIQRGVTLLMPVDGNGQVSWWNFVAAVRSMDRALARDLSQTKGLPFINIEERGFV